MEYKIIRSGRKTLSIEIGKNGIIVRAPFQATDKQITDFVEKRSEWLKKNIEVYAQRMKEKENEIVIPFTQEEIADLTGKALVYIPQRVKYFAQLIGVNYERVTIRKQKSKWGSCSSKGNLNFNCLLMLTPEDVIDSVVVHELCHFKHPNHSKDFYALVRSIYPEYDKCDKWLKENGAAIVNRL